MAVGCCSKGNVVYQVRWKSLPRVNVSEFPSGDLLFIRVKLSHDQQMIARSFTACGVLKLVSGRRLVTPRATCLCVLQICVSTGSRDTRM